VVAVTDKIACLSIDLEPDLHDAQGRVRLLDDDARLEALRSLLVREQVPITVFTVMSHARRFADRLRALTEGVPAEHGVHSYSHDTDNPNSSDEILRAWDTFGEIWNRKPLGYRSPNCLIDDAGMDRLAAAGFMYDSSIVPSVRPDSYSYNHLNVSTAPYVHTGPSGRLVEMPIACLRGIRLPFIFSYVKLLGLAAYSGATALFPLPDTAVTYFHPYDLYSSEVAPAIHGWKRYAHARNGRRGMELLAGVIALLRKRGYRFALMGDVATTLLEHPERTSTLAVAG
jgi:hypothetical protein